MSYNLLYGAGVDRAWDAALPIEFTGRNRLSDVLSVIKKVDPQILGIQEANSWDKGTPTVIQHVAQELGMNSYLARTPGGFHVGLLSKFEIVETENYSSEIGKQGAMRAMLVAPGGERLNVFVAHLDPNVSDIRLCEVNALISLMQPYTQRRALLIGDMNFRPPSPEFARLAQAGWKSVAVEPSWGIDQIWIYPSAAWDASSSLQTLFVPSGISDHYPVAAELTLPPAIREATTLATPSLTPAQAPVTFPLFLSESLNGAQVSRRENFQDACVMSKWNSRWSTEKITKNGLEIEGEERWQAFATRYKEFVPGQGILVRLQFSPASEFEMYFENGSFSSDVYRRYGINVRDRALQSIAWESRTQRRGENFGEGARLSTASWYYLLLAVSKSGEMLVQVWDPSDFSRALKTRQRLGEGAAALPWTFQVAVNRGKVLVDEVTEISFSDLK